MANDVLAPEVARGEVVIVGRYSEAKPKVALVNQTISRCSKRLMTSSPLWTGSSRLRSTS